ncbi:hypothetical protein [Actinomadura yumaensis]|uniref:Gluconate 2-dehydrogenase subunit 3 family protein n=1 Tax=Actinomadura yumaensis TaxID=111807 RepID=A0ABW2CT20_9ACTN
MSDEPQRERRAVLGTAGLLAAATAVPGLASPARAGAAGPPAAGTGIAESQTGGPGAAARDALTLDTMRGLAVFVMPGPDAYSRAQGTPAREPGGIEARLPEFLVDALDRYLPAPDLPAVPLVRALRDGVPGLLREPVPDAALRAGLGVDALLESDATIPLSPLVALLLNAEALRVDPRTVAGPFLAPFSRLAFGRKADVFELLEGADPDLVELLDARLPEPLKRTASGLLRFLGGALLELAALGGYSEWAVFDPASRRLRDRPVGWRISGYTPAAEGRPEFRGYYQGRTEVTG